MRTKKIKPRKKAHTAAKRKKRKIPNYFAGITALRSAMGKKAAAERLIKEFGLKAKALKDRLKKAEAKAHLSHHKKLLSFAKREIAAIKKKI